MIELPEGFDSVFRYIVVVSQRAEQLINGAKPRTDSSASPKRPSPEGTDSDSPSTGVDPGSKRSRASASSIMAVAPRSEKVSLVWVPRDERAVIERQQVLLDLRIRETLDQALGLEQGVGGIARDATRQSLVPELIRHPHGISADSLEVDFGFAEV
mgnify:CR=1 FL=1